MPDGSNIAADLRRRLNINSGLVVLSMLLVVGVGVYAVRDSGQKSADLARAQTENVRAQNATNAKLAAEVAHNRRDQRVTRKALCTFVNDLRDRIDQTETFLKTNPGIYAKLGVTPGQVKQSLDGQRRTVQSLHLLDCPPVRKRTK